VFIFSGGRSAFRDNAEPELPQPALPTLNTPRVNVGTYVHNIVAVFDEFQSHRSQKKTGTKTPIGT
jgi:hypothetical protein